MYIFRVWVEYAAREAFQMDSAEDKDAAEDGGRQKFDWGFAAFLAVIVGIIICYLLEPESTGAVLMWALGGIAAIKG